MTVKRISIAGAGRVATALCNEFRRHGFKIDHIVSATESSCRKLAQTCGASWSTIPHFPATTDIIIVSVPDHRIEGLLREIECGPGTLVAHTSGSTPLSVFPPSFRSFGVFYPLQTFSEDRKISFSGLPLLVEASDSGSLKKLSALAATLGCDVHEAGSEARALVHVAAVFACNFSNHMLAAGNELAARSGFGPGILKPLLEETINKALVQGPEISQTGPAVRNDINTIEKHLDLLSFSPRLKRLYMEVTRSIREYYNTGN